MNAVKQEQAVNWEDRRAETRHKATGTVALRLEENFPVTFEGRLLDISSSGFRVLHFNAQLRSGQECEFLLPGTQGRARVVWNRTTPEHIETGFLIVSCQPV